MSVKKERKSVNLVGNSSMGGSPKRQKAASKSKARRAGRGAARVAPSRQVARRRR